MLDLRERSRDELEEIRRLEELWHASPQASGDGRNGLGSGARALALAGRRLGVLVAGGWALFFALAALAPAPEPEAVTPLWAELVLAAFFLALGAAALCAWLRASAAAFGAATVAGLVGLAIAAGCKATEHHAGSWWLAELGAAAVLTGLAAAGLARTRRERAGRPE